MENTLDPVNCDQPPCLIAGACVLKSELLVAQQAYLNHLATLSLNDLINKQTQQRINNIPIVQEPMA
jgi:DNA-binding IscR family transcriptional regulator